VLGGKKIQEPQSEKSAEKRMESMHRILSIKEIAPQVKQVKIYSPEIAQKAQAGQFIILRVDKEGERIPLTLAAWDKTDGSITLIFQEVGVSTKKIAKLNVKDKILNIAGPLGSPSCIKNYGTAIVVCGGIGTAAAYPIAKALKEAGNRVISIIGARNEKLLVLEEEMRQISDELYISTDDGSKGHKGFVSDVLKSLIDKKYQIDIVYAIGPPIMMRVTSEVTRPYGIRTRVSLNPIMVDGMGMCGACRVTVANTTKFACIDGPEFDAHTTNFDELMKRLRVYPTQEKSALESYEKIGGICKCQK
jgi:ferredoxin/flavodoxin---NADP+ reductase